MKIPFPKPVESRKSRVESRKLLEGRRSKVEGQGSASGNVRLSTLDPRPSTACEGVALVITLILLGVVTFMALAFLALSRRERGSVTTVTDTASARLAADAALAKAEAQIMANVQAGTNPFNFGLLVSTNYINPYGFQSGVANLTNVNYDFRTDHQPFSQADLLQNLANLYYSPRPPVFIATNSAGSNDFRFYLDLNRNGRFDTNGWVTNVDFNLQGLGTTNFQWAIRNGSASCNGPMRRTVRTIPSSRATRSLRSRSATRWI